MDYMQLYAPASLFEWWIPQVNLISTVFLLLPEKHPQFYSDKNKICNLNEHCPTNNRHNSFLTAPVRAVNTTQLFTQTEERVGRIRELHRRSDQKINENSDVLSTLTLNHTRHSILIKNFSVSSIKGHVQLKYNLKRMLKHAK